MKMNACRLKNGNYFCNGLFAVAKPCHSLVQSQGWPSVTTAVLKALRLCAVERKLRMRFLLLEDDLILGEGLRDFLMAEAHVVDWFTRLVDAPYGRVPEMELCNTLIDYAMALEGGKMSASEFDIKRRQAQLDYARRKDAAGTNVFVPASF